jgi:quinol monooxygenase YgiN
VLTLFDFSETFLDEPLHEKHDKTAIVKDWHALVPNYRTSHQLIRRKLHATQKKNSQNNAA